MKTLRAKKIIEVINKAAERDPEVLNYEIIVRTQDSSGLKNYEIEEAFADTIKIYKKHLQIIIG